VAQLMVRGTDERFPTLEGCKQYLCVGEVSVGECGRVVSIT